MSAFQDEMKEAVMAANAPLLAKILELSEKVDTLTGEHSSDLLTVAEAAKVKRVTEATVRQWVSKGKIDSQRAGSKILIPRSALI
ncbi:helix-turn-helix domain-containing protein [Halocynthiibacter sp.]|uniref:helix-turn-helix domain-containing protein n=1 Tax=Halocynthiibacter sp. TaxID=1979210 RepID=UPI003C6387E4